MGRENRSLIARVAGLDQQLVGQPLEMFGGNRVEPFERDVLHDHRLPFGDLDRDVDLGLVRIQSGVDADDFGIGVAAVGVIRLDALDVAVELCAIEVVPARPREEPILTRGDDALELLGFDRLDAAERDRRDLHVAGLAARRHR